jgi:Alw26I/Eco31I/Esp3I family type II restriction m6 adenine DNA methyltransferase
MPEQTKLFIWNNQNLFSNNYLEYRLPETDLWKSQKEKAAAAFEEIRKAYESIKPLNLGPGEEAGLEEKFIRPVLRVLGFELDIQPTTKRGTKKKRPDYALFKDDESYRAARKFKDNPDQFFSLSLTILEAKYWRRRLNDTDKKDVLDSRDPTAQTIKYLDSVNLHTGGKINFAILTNGKQWRLFYNRAASRSGNYFEIDLEEIIKRADTDKFLYFYLFFSKDAFVPDPVTGNTWLDQHLKGTEDYASRVSIKLKNLIFDQVFEGLTSGFIYFGKTELALPYETDKNRRDIFKGCLTLLYRLLFILYAESRNLLPVGEDGYYKVSLTKLKKDINQDLKTLGHGKMSKRSYVYWARLHGLFDIIAKGEPSLNVPIYNGGLFETPADSFLAIHKMPDPFIADAIEQLTVDHEGDYKLGDVPFIDYSSLSVRHLGDVYEGLLEFHIQIAEEETVEVKDKGKAFWKKLSEVKTGAKTYRVKNKGEVYIENSKHERKATGSFYTPHFSVEYIVGNTVGPVLDEKLKIADGLLSQFAGIQKKALNNQLSVDSIRGYKAKIKELEDEIFNTIFGIKVLDPAMGSGHFLVYTVDYISDRIIAFLADYPENPVIKKIEELKGEILSEIKRQGVRIDESKLTEVNLIKRMVMKKCIYGVDLNDMAVELAKLSLWLDSFTLGAPLSFLDHHLKCGNSLIGVFDISDVIIPGSEMYGQVQRALSYMLQVSELTDATVSEAKTSYDLFKKGREAIAPLMRRFDASIAKYFMDTGWNPRIEQLAYTLNFDGEPFAEVVEKCKKALMIAGENRFFHWKVEFPEVFYTNKGEKENPGFDCTVGNPPYDVLSELEQDKEVEPERDFFRQNKLYLPAVGGKLNLYRLFVVMSLLMLRKNGMHGFIVPMALLADKQAKPLREFILRNYRLKTIEAFPQKDDPANRVFEEAKLSTCIYIIQKTEPKQFTIRIHPGKSILPSSATLNIEMNQIENFDNENLSIPSYPNMTTKDFYLALKLREVSKGITLKQFAPSQQGEVNLTEHSEFFTKDQNGKVVLRGAHVNRYEFREEPKQGTPVFLDVDDFLDAHGADTKAYDYKHKRIGYQRGSAIDNWRRIIATIIEENEFCSDTINYIVNPKEYDLYAVLALLNSSLWEWRFRLTSTNNHVNAYEIDFMPMPPVSFTTPEKERKERVNEAIELYKKYMLELSQNGKSYEKAESSEEPDRPVADGTYDRGKEKSISGKHPAAGTRIHGIRRRARKPKDAEKIPDGTEEV